MLPKQMLYQAELRPDAVLTFGKNCRTGVSKQQAVGRWWVAPDRCARSWYTRPQNCATTGDGRITNRVNRIAPRISVASIPPFQSEIARAPLASSSYKPSPWRRV